MPRAARLDIPGLLQHVIFRGVDRCDLFRDDADRGRFLASFSKLLLQTGTECLAWSLLTNHVHLLLCPRQTRLAPFMRRLLTCYAIYFNLRHKRTGHLFQNRYKSIVCDEDAYLFELVRYIHLNPLRAGLVTDLATLDNYPWSGHAVLLGKGMLEGQVIDEVLTLFGNKPSEARQRYRQFVADGVAQGTRDDLTSGKMRRTTQPDEPYDQRILGGGDFIETLRTQQGLTAELARDIDIPILIGTVCEHFSVDPELLKRKTRKAGVAEVRSVVCYLVACYSAVSGSEVGRSLGLSRAGVSVATRRGEVLVKNNSALLKLIDK